MKKRMEETDLRWRVSIYVAKDDQALVTQIERMALAERRSFSWKLLDLAREAVTKGGDSDEGNQAV